MINFFSRYSYVMYCTLLLQDDCIAISHIKNRRFQECQTLNLCWTLLLSRGHSLNNWESTIRQEACIKVISYIIALKFLRTIHSVYLCKIISPPLWPHLSLRDHNLNKFKSSLHEIMLQNKLQLFWASNV